MLRTVARRRDSEEPRRLRGKTVVAGGDEMHAAETVAQTAARRAEKPLHPRGYRDMAAVRQSLGLPRQTIDGQERQHQGI